MRYLLEARHCTGKSNFKENCWKGEAKNLVNLEFESFRIKMDDEQYYDVLMLAQISCSLPGIHSIEKYIDLL